MQKIDVHGLSRRGSSHESNHDHFAIASLNKSMCLHQSNLSIDDDSRVHGVNQGHLFLVADGISGAPAPARASGHAVDSVVNYFLDELPWYHLADGHPADVTLALEEALRNAEEDLLQRGNRGEAGMGTTMTLAFVSWPNLYLAHVGAGRCYLKRAQAVRQLTTDHTLAEFRRGIGGTAQARGQHLLWNAVGGDGREVFPEVRHSILETGDVLALVTDGLHSEAPSQGLDVVLDSELPAREVCQRLVGEGGEDDQTAIVVRFLPHERLRVASHTERVRSPLVARTAKPASTRDGENARKSLTRKRKPRAGTRPAKRVS